MSAEKSNGGASAWIELKTGKEVFDRQLSAEQVRADANEAIVEHQNKLLRLAKEALEKAIPLAESWSAPYKQGLEVCHEAIAAINDSNLVEGLVLCDAKPVAYLEGNQEGLWFVAYSANEKAPQCPLYAVRRAKK